MDPEKKVAIFYTTYFCFRRLMVAFLTIYINSDVSIIFAIYEFVIMATISFHNIYKPMERKSIKEAEIMHEMLLMFITYYMLLFTGMVGDVALRFELGKYFVFFFISALVVSLLFIIIWIIEEIIQKRRLNKKRKAWLEAWEDKIEKYYEKDLEKELNK